MKRTFGFGFVVAILLASLSAPAFARGATLRYETRELAIEVAGVYERLSLPEHVSLSRPGEPELPSRIYRFVIPADQRVEDVVVTSLVEEALPGTHRVMPALAEAPIGERQQAPQPDATVYEGGGVYPRERVVYLGDGWLGGYRIASFAVHPVQYEPVTGRLVLAREVSFEVELGPGARRSRARHRMTERSSDLYRRLVRRLVDNPEEVSGAAGGSAEVVEVADGPGFAPRYTPSLNGSPVDYVIVTNELLAPYFQDLADWKTEKGIPAVVKTVSWIEANYPGGCDTAEKVRLFLQDAYSSWGTTYVLLGGDTDVVPHRMGFTTYYGGDDIPADLYYSDLDGNWNWDGDEIFGESYKSAVAPGDSVDLYPDVIVGRAPVNSVVELETFLDKCEAYRSSPVSHFTDRNLILSDVLFPYDWDGGTYSLDGAADITEPAMSYFPGHLHNVRMYANREGFPESYPIDAPSTADSIDQGYNLVVHVGHGSKDVVRTNLYNYLGMSDVADFTNGMSKGSFMWFLNCTTTAIDYDCIGERVMTNPNGGATALYGPTRFAFPATCRDYYWDWLDLIYNDGIQEIGAAGAYCKARHASYGESGYDNTSRWTQYSFVLLGDPEMSLWTDRPETLSVTHPPTMQVGDSGMSLTVTDPAAVDSARVCVFKDGDVYETGFTSASGEITLDFVPDTPGTLRVTVTAANHLPYQADVTVGADSDAHLYVDAFDVDDDGDAQSSGNGNGSAEAGETVEIDLSVTNGGVAATGDVTATLRGDDTYIAIEDSTEAIGSVAAGAPASAPEAFRFAIGNDCPNEHDVTFTVVLSEAARVVWSDEVTIRVMRPDLVQLRVALDDSSGDGDGIPETGETVDVVIEVLNEGNGDAVAVTGTLTNPCPGVSVTDSTDAWGDILAGTSVDGSGGFSFDVTGAIGSPFRLELADALGKTWLSYLDFTRPAAPESLAGSVKGTTIFLTWEPVVDADLKGYDIHRSMSRTGPYALANGDIIEGSSYFSDVGLDENTVYFFHITAIDSSGNESESSDTLEISTNPPSQLGWPLATGGGMYSSPLAADIDGDGDLEVLVGAEEVYAWHHDGTEIFDGDGDPRTSGVFASDGRGGYRATLAVGEIDGDVGVEMVGAAWANVGTPEDKEYEVFVWNADDGSLLSGWPVTTQGFCWGSPALADFDFDGRCEVIISCSDGWLYCWSHDGAEYIDGDSDPLTVGRFAWLGNKWAYGSPAIVDLDDDGEYEILQPSTNDSVYCFNTDGTRVPGWPVYVEMSSQPSPAVGDVDKDGDIEIVVVSEANYAWLLEADGSVAPGWPKGIYIDGDFPPSPVLADVTGDGYLEIVQVGSDGTVRIWDYEGHNVSGWPRYLGSGSRSSASVADVDGDPDVEIVVGCNDGKVYGFDTDGSTLPGWPIQTGAEVYASPLIVDLDDDGDSEIVVSGLDTYVYIWDSAGLYDNGDRVEWGCFLHDNWRTQHYDYDVPVGVEDGGGIPAGDRKLVLEQNLPNPFNPTTTIAFTVSDAPGTRVELRVYAVDGSLVRTLLDGSTESGRCAVLWNGRDDRGRDVGSGVYFYRLTVGGESRTRKMVLLK